jgi:hypothetical protein
MNKLLSVLLATAFTASSFSAMAIETPKSGAMDTPVATAPAAEKKKVMKHSKKHMKHGKKAEAAK